jgi:predicted dehydrogenase
VFRVAILSFWHVHAWDYAAEAEAHPGVDLVGVWDEEIGRGREEAQRRGVRFYRDLGELLSSPEVDGVVVTTPTVAHREVIPAAARAGKHVFTEKVIAPTLRETREVVAAVEREDVVLVVSLPRLYAGYTAAIARALDEGLPGEVTHLRVRVSHDGALRTQRNPEGWLPSHFFDPEQSAGGVLTDFGAHPLYLLRYIMGMPEEISASYGYVTGRAIEDNAVVTFRYPGGAVGVAEASFVGAGVPFVIEAHGTGGSLLYLPDDGLRARRAGADRWETVTVPPDGPSPFEMWVDHSLRRMPAPENVRVATDLSALAEAANRSAAGGRTVALPPPSGETL